MTESIFKPTVEIFKICNVEIIANFENGALVGLTRKASQICKQVLDGSKTKSDISSIDAALASYFDHNGFFKSSNASANGKTAYLHVTDRCHQSCYGCYSASSSRNTIADPSFEQLQRAVHELVQCGFTNINISGGEPFLRDDLPRITRMIKESGAERLEIATGAPLIYGFQVEDLADSVDVVNISFDGTSSTDPSYLRKDQRFETRVRLINDLVSADIIVRILPTLHARNINDIPRYIKLANEFNCLVGFSLLSHPVNSNEIEELLLDDSSQIELAKALLQVYPAFKQDLKNPQPVSLTAKRICGAGTKLISISADGNVYPCHMLHRSEYLAGTIFNQSLQPMLYKLENMPFRISVDELKGCSECEYRLICGGGCRARAINSSCSENAIDPYCAFFRQALGAFFCNATS